MSWAQILMAVSLSLQTVFYALCIGKRLKVDIGWVLHPSIVALLLYWGGFW